MKRATGVIQLAVLSVALTACAPLEPSPYAAIAPAPALGQPAVTLLADMSGTSD